MKSSVNTGETALHLLFMTADQGRPKQRSPGHSGDMGLYSVEKSVLEIRVVEVKGVNEVVQVESME